MNCFILIPLCWLLFVGAKGINCTNTFNKADCLAGGECSWCFFKCNELNYCPQTCDSLSSTTLEECTSLTTAIGVVGTTENLWVYGGVAVPLNSSMFQITFNTTNSRGNIATKNPMSTTSSSIKSVEIELDFNMWFCGSGSCADGFSVIIADAQDYTGEAAVVGSGGNSFGFVSLKGGWMAVVFDSFCSNFFPLKDQVYVLSDSETVETFAIRNVSAGMAIASINKRHVQIKLEIVSSSLVLITTILTDLNSSHVVTIFDHQNLTTLGPIPTTIRVGIIGTTGGLFSIITIYNPVVTINGETLEGKSCTWCDKTQECSIDSACNTSCAWAITSEQCHGMSRCHWCSDWCLENSTSCSSMCGPHCNLCNKTGCLECENGYAGPNCYIIEELLCYGTKDKFNCTNDGNCNWCSDFSYCTTSRINCSTCSDLAKTDCDVSDKCKWINALEKCASLFDPFVSCNGQSQSACSTLPGCLWCSVSSDCKTIENYESLCTSTCSYKTRNGCDKDKNCSWCSQGGLCLKYSDPCSNIATKNDTECLAYWCDTLKLCVSVPTLCPPCSSAITSSQCTDWTLSGCSWCESSSSCIQSNLTDSSCECSSYITSQNCSTTSCKWCSQTSTCQASSETCFGCFQLQNCNVTTKSCTYCNIVRNCIEDDVYCQNCDYFNETQCRRLPGCQIFNGLCVDSIVSSVAIIPQSSSNSKNNLNSGWWIILVSVLGGVIGIAALAFVIGMICVFSRKKAKSSNNPSDTPGIALVQTDLDGMHLVELSELGLEIVTTSLDFSQTFPNGVPVAQTISRHFTVMPLAKSSVDVAFVAPVSNLDKWKVKVYPLSVKKLKATLSVEFSLTFNCTTTLEGSLAICNKSRGTYGLVPLNISAALSSKLDFDEIEVGPEIGRGGFGTVLRGVWRKTEVAIKEVPKSMMESEDFRQEFEREVSILSSLRSPFIVCFYGTVLTRDHCSIVMEFVPLGSLDKTLLNEKLSEGLKTRIALDAASGMAVLHGNGILHRDLKSENLLVVSLSRRAPVRVKLTDFGSSRAVADIEAKAKYTKGIGTPAYMAPEILAGHQYNMKSDVYSFGILLWMILTQKMPFEEIKNNFALITHVSEGKRLELPESPLSPLVERCWAQEPADRPVFEEIVNELKSHVK